ncbi:hypothetical protein MPLB_2420013 [Mesorhizobium sp. ORS 3324]|nr:hypothetical protein MPLB_2420013 [Mesorhizobium sp. ORS 3324]
MLRVLRGGRAAANPAVWLGGKFRLVGVRHPNAQLLHTPMLLALPAALELSQTVFGSLRPWHARPLLGCALPQHRRCALPDAFACPNTNFRAARGEALKTAVRCGAISGRI